MGLALADIEGKYEIVAKIREGGMGAIYKVRHRLLDEIRVVKVLRPQHEDDRELQARFAREARSAIRLRHPNVVQLFDFSLDESGAGLIVMEFISGTDLSQLIQQKRLPSVPLALEIARQSLRSLGFLHQHGFVHRDVSPDNLMLTLDVDLQPLVKLIDLGIAKRHDAEQQLTVSGSFLGKFRYASPEHFGAKGPDGVEARSDLYTLGLALYELLTGTYPMPGASTSQLIASHLFHQPHDFAQTDADERVPADIRRMVLKALAKNPNERFQDARQWIDEIENLQATFPLQDAAIEEARTLVARAAKESSGSTPQPGSTQLRLDRSFGIESTPRPKRRSSRDDGSQADGDTQLNVLLAGAETLMQLDQIEQAKQQLDTILRIDPDHQGARDLALLLDADSEGHNTTVVDSARPTTEVIEPAPEDAEQKDLDTGLDAVAVMIGDGQFLAAEQQLRQLAEAHGRGARVHALEVRLEDLRSAEITEQVREHLSQANAHIDAGDYPQALACLREAQAEAPEDGPLHQEVSQGVRRLHTKVQERERDRAIEEIARHVWGLIEDHHLEEARVQLDKARDSYGEADRFLALRRALDHEMQERLNALAHEAGLALEAGRYPTAIGFLEQVVEIDPENRWLQGQLEVARDKVEQQAAEERKAAELERSRQTELMALNAALDTADLEVATIRFDAAAARWGDEAVDEARPRLEELRRQRSVELVEEARAAHADGDLFKARLLIAQARRSTPDDPVVAKYSNELDAEAQQVAKAEGKGKSEGDTANNSHEASGDASPAQTQNTTGLLATIAEIERLRVEAQSFQAWKAVQAAIERFGEMAVLVELRQELADQMLEDTGN